MKSDNSKAPAFSSSPSGGFSPEEYRKTLEWMYSCLPAYQLIGSEAYKPTLENTRRLMTHLGNPENGFSSVHVAGTNGKGSTAHLLASVFMEAGYRTGLFTSPHLVDFRERIRVDGEMIPEGDVMDFMRGNRSFFEENSLSFFEMNVGLAFDHFRRSGVEVAIVETGLGGRLDSTNVIVPEVSVITNIGLDHTAILGDTLEKIAAEKAGIIKAGVPVVVGEASDGPLEVFRHRAAECGSELVLSEPCPPKYVELCPLKGFYQRKNLSTVLAVVDRIRRQGTWKITDRNVEDGIAHVLDNTHLQGRWQVLHRSPTVVCDTGHNPHGIKEIVRQLEGLPDGNLRIVFGMVSDKDVFGVLSLLPSSAQYYFTRASVPRAMDEKELFAIAIRAGLKGRCFPNLKEALCTALAESSADDFIYVGGSTFLVADILREKMF